MRKTSLDLLRDRDLRCFFAAWAASSIGSGAGYVALLFAAQQRFGAGGAVGAVLLAQFAPAMLFGVALGRQVDRRSRRRCALVGDFLGAAAFVALAFSGPLALVIAFGAAAGLGTAIAGPAHMAPCSRAWRARTGFPPRPRCTGSSTRPATAPGRCSPRACCSPAGRRCFSWPTPPRSWSPRRRS